MSFQLVRTAVVICMAVGFITCAGAAPVSGQGTWETTLQARDLDGDSVTDAYYDTVLNITWLADWNAAAGSGYDEQGTGAMTWDNARDWTNSLKISGYDGWRLPTMVDTGPAGCDISFNGTDCGSNVQTLSDDTVYSEMAHLWYVTLGNLGYFDTSGEPQVGGGLTNTGPFINMGGAHYWSRLQYAPNLNNFAWYFDTEFGIQFVQAKDSFLYAVAVRDGDVAVAAVPEPATWVLLMLGLGAGMVVRRRRPGWRLVSRTG